MKIEEARSTYNVQLRAYQEKKLSLAKERQELQKKIEKTENGAVVYANEAATLELSYKAVSDKYKEYAEYMEELMGQWSSEVNMRAAQQQGDAAQKQGEEMAKIIEVARRLMKGAKVPYSDEKKLMEFDEKMYQMAKQIGLMAQQRKKKKYDSLWDDEEPEKQEDPMEAANNEEAFADGPEIVSVEDTMAQATASGE